MKRFKDLSIRAKLILIILGVSFFVVVLIGGARLVWDLRQERQTLVREMSTLTRLLGDRSSAALAFDDAHLAQENLASLQALPHVVLACLYRNDGTQLAEYQRDNAATTRCPLASQLADRQVRFEADRLHVAAAVRQDTLLQGWIYLGSDLSLIEARLRSQVTISGLALLAAILITGLLAAWLQRLISGPITAITEVARAIEKQGGHHLRAPVASHDEVGQLARTFNAMLDTLKTQNRQLVAARAEEQAASALYRNLVESTSAIPWEVDLVSWCFTYIGHQAEKIFGYPVEAWYQEGFWSEHIHPEDREATVNFCVGATDRGEDYQFEYRMLAIDGHSVWIHNDAQVISENGKPVLLQGFMFDISGRKRHEEAIKNIAAGVSAETGEPFFRHLVQHLATIFDADYAFIGVLDKNDTLQVNTLAVCAHGQIVDNMSYSLVGTPCANVMGQSTCAYPEGVRQQFPEDRMLVDMGVEGYIGTPLFDSKGAPRGILVVLDGKPLRRVKQVGELLEIFAARAGAEVERLRAEESVRKLSQAVEQSPNVVVITDTKGVIEYVNPSFTTITGYTRQDAIGQTPRLLQSGQTAPEVYRGLWATIKAGQTWRGELVNRRKDGSLYTDEQTITPLHGPDGTITHYVAVKQDISERLRTEEVLRRSQKMDAIGQLSGGIAHDFNNQLGVIIGYLDFLRDYAVHDEKTSKWVETATKATLHCMDLTRQLLTFSRRQAKEKTVVDLNATLMELETMIARSVTPAITLRTFLADDLGRTEVDPGELQDAILNLVINARDAMPGGGSLLIETCNKHLDAGYVDLNPGVEAGDYVQLMLSDTGSGMDQETLEHIFEPFFTTKPEGKGTGLGLAMVYGFVKRYGGHIKVYSEPGVGTTIRIYLPRTTASESAMVQDARVADLPSGSESILIVDDEVSLLALADHYLSDLGYRVLQAENAAQALEILATDEEIDLLFSDVVMPGGMNGYELAQRATEQRPGLKVLLTSGFTSTTMAHNGLSRFAAHLLNKPYRKDNLAQRIRLVLNEETTA